MGKSVGDARLRAPLGEGSRSEDLNEAHCGTLHRPVGISSMRQARTIDKTTEKFIEWDAPGGDNYLWRSHLPAGTPPWKADPAATG